MITPDRPMIVKVYLNHGTSPPPPPKATTIHNEHIMFDQEAKPQNLDTTSSSLKSMPGKTQGKFYPLQLFTTKERITAKKFRTKIDEINN